MDFIRKHAIKLPALFVCFVFVQSLFFKFTRNVETIYIFEEKLDPWAASLGFPGLFAPGGLFSAYVVGSAELVASSLILFGTLTARPRIQGLGALLGLAVISGAIMFHLFTPLGVSVRNADGSFDGGQLFAMACLVWLACLLIAFVRRNELLGLIGIRRSMTPA
ncbi:hypothetical protein [uncultured Nevskia sp.]|uniref:hypothetical protein n=1 Tax=uncultured Nevskia sp. TaxID=228950 RepID=UPI0025F07317|nr:hypothetical protein [uncultured Nevskia sp.]